MSEHLPYHDEQWDEMPLPNGEEAWQKMKLLLDKEEKKRRVFPFWFWRYGLLGLLLMGTAAGGYFFLNRKGEGQTGFNLGKENIQEKEKREQGIGQKISTTTNSWEKKGSSIPYQKLSRKTTHQDEVTKAEKRKETFDEGILLSLKQNKEGQNSTEIKQASVTKPPVQSKRVRSTPNMDTKAKLAIVPGKNEAIVSSVDKNLTSKKDSTKQVATSAAAKDSVVKKDSAKIVAAPPMVSNNANEKTKRKAPILFSAGVGLQQAIAFNGQQGSSFNLAGKQRGLSDYLPLVYLRLQKENWFLQGEFHYNVPQPVKPVSFSQATMYNAIHTVLQTEKVSIQKLYYHQLPLSVNYFVLPHWSVGAGGTYNLLAGAVTEEETESKNVTSGSETFSSRMVPVKGYRDSFLYKSAVGVLLQTDYHWKRFSFGLRYIKNVQPFIKYTRPDGAVLDEKNQVLQAVIRFRIKG